MELKLSIYVGRRIRQAVKTTDTASRDRDNRLPIKLKNSEVSVNKTGGLLQYKGPKKRVSGSTAEVNERCRASRPLQRRPISAASTPESSPSACLGWCSRDVFAINPIASYVLRNPPRGDPTDSAPPTDVPRDDVPTPCRR